MDYNLEIFNPHKATDQTWDIYFNHTESIFLEGQPEDKPHPRELEKNFMININPYYDIYRWIIISKQEPKKIIGMGLLYFENEKAPNFESVKKVATLNLSIDKEYRRKGWATRMFKTLVQKALDLGK
ncbi:MAG: GNAT family N-acetyltransferase, partial [Candidatus Heimdallarchaeota archaeon]